MTEPELSAVQETGILRGGISGDTFFTEQVYNTGAEAQSALSLKTAPTIRVDFTMVNDPVISGPQIVRPDYGYPGGGIESWSSDPIIVFLTSVTQLLP